jgi:Asp-tRNA(Asn)/Glu-tRNA(Gln) amidotransferase A subunit family amidase
MRNLFIVLGFLLLSNPAVCQDKLSVMDIQSAEKIIDVQFSPAKNDSLLSSVQSRTKIYERMHRIPLGNSVPLSTSFSPVLPYMKFDKKQLPVHFTLPDGVKLPANKNDLAFYSIPQLASLLKNKKITSVDLTRFFLNRLKQYGDTLQCVIELTEDIAMKEAAQADKEIASGKYRGLLHGIPYGLKDLFSVKGTRTTWGAEPYKDQVIDENSYAYQKLKGAGAVLVAKLTLGALAMGDYWFGGQTKSPWNLLRGSSGSSAGSAAATVAGLVPFAIGTETHGSIISPSNACGATGLRPTFGSISRSGAMTLSWTLDKTGPICRSAEDAAIVFNYLHGNDQTLSTNNKTGNIDNIQDGADASAVNMPFNYKEKIDLSKMKIAYAQNYFNKRDTMGNENAVLEAFKKAGAKLMPINFPDSGVYHFNMMSIVIGAESSAAFDDFSRTGLDDKMTHQDKDAWPNYFRAARFIPATEYLNANRHRYVLMQEVNKVIEQYDVIICPTWGGSQVAITNLTGHPAVIFPTGFDKNKMPTTITLIGKLYDEATLLAIAKVYQDATGWNKMHPKLFK